MRSSYKSESDSIPTRLLFVPLRETVVFPFVVVPLFFPADEGTLVFDNALMEGGLIGFVGQRNPHLKNPQPKDLLSV